MEGLDLVETGKWLWVAIVAPVLGWIAGLGGGRLAAKRRKKARIAHLRGYPPEIKTELIQFYVQGTHTVRGDPGSPAMLVLREQGVVKAGPGGGTYDAIDRYLTIRSDLWEVMDDWVASDLIALKLMQDALEPARY